ncbi:MAG: hypothetical protein V4671_24940, partial [Armatimonadota bacterium]
PADVQSLIKEGKLTPSHGERLVRFADFPVVCSIIAERAVGNKTPAADLDGKNIPFEYELGNRGVIKRFYASSANFDTSVCKKCPFSAYRSGNYTDYGYCLKPEHFEQLEREATLAQQEALRAAQEATTRAAAEIEEAAAFGEIPASNGEPETAKKVAAIKHLPMIDSLRSGSYTDLSYKSSLPAGCTEGCPCRAAAIRNYKGEAPKVVPICSNPARFEKLQSADTRSNKKAARTAFAEREKAAQEVLELNPLIVDFYVSPAVHRQVVVAVWDSLRSAGKTAVEPAAKRLGIEIDFTLWDKRVDGGYAGRPSLWDALEKLPIPDLIRLTVEAHLGREILAKFGYSNPKPTDKLAAIDWIAEAGSEVVNER